MTEGVFIIGPSGQMNKLVGTIGVTPECPKAMFRKLDVVRLRRRKHLSGFPPVAAIVAVVPPGFSPDWAMDDLWGEPRRLMHRVGALKITYIVAFEGNPVPYLLHERDLLPTGERCDPIILKREQGEP